MNIKNLFELSILAVNVIGFLSLFYKIGKTFGIIQATIDNLNKRVERLENAVELTGKHCKAIS